MSVPLSPVQEWLRGIGLPRDSVQRAGDVFEEHNIDADLMDFLTGAEGSRILAAWRDRAANAARPNADSAVTSGAEQKEDDGRAKLGRQRLSTAERQSCSHYFAPAGRNAEHSGQRAAEPPKRRQQPKHAASSAASAPSDPASPSAAPPTSSAGSVGSMAQGLAQAMSSAASMVVGSRNSDGKVEASKRRQGPLLNWSQELPPERQATPEDIPRAAKASLLASSTWKEPKETKKVNEVKTPPRQAAGGALKNWASQEDGDASKRKDPVLITTGRRCQGALKNFNAEKGYGFIASTCEEGDIFVHRKDLPEGEPQAGRALQFDLVYTDGKDGRKPQARNVVWATEKRFNGYVKSLGDEYGFISCEEARQMYGRDVYVTRGQLPTHEHMKLSFAIVVNSKGQPQATDIECEEPIEDLGDSDGDCSAAHEVPTTKVQRW